MKCPFCGSTEMIVSNSRETYNGYSTWRRRKCIHCLNTFTTYETVNLNYIIVIKKDSSKQRYSHEKLFSSILNSFIKLKNVDTGDCAKNANHCIKEVEKKMIEKKRKAISTKEIFDLTTQVLIEEDIRAAMNYISYFYKAKDEKELKQILQNYITAS